MSDPLQNRRLHARTSEAFSLIEVALAIAITGFAVVSLVTLLPIGLQTFRQAMDTAVSAQIAQRVVSDVQETDFDTLVSDALPEEGQFYVLPTRYFDDQGSEIHVGNPDAPAPEELQRVLYTVRVRGSRPGERDPSDHTTDYFTSLPSKGGKRFNPRDLTILTVQVVSNPTNKKLEIDKTTLLLSEENARAQNVPMQTFSTIVARNGYLNAPPQL